MWNTFLKTFLLVFSIFVMVMPNPDINNENHVASSKTSMDIQADIQPIQITARIQNGIRIATYRPDSPDVLDSRKTLKEKQFFLWSNDGKDAWTKINQTIIFY